MIRGDGLCGTSHPFLLPGDLFSPHQELKSPQQQRIWFVKRVTLCSGEVLFYLISKICVYLLGKEPVVIIFFFLEAADLIYSSQP